MEIRKTALSLIVLSIIGVVIFTTTPLISARERVQGSDAGGSWDILITFKITFWGKGKLVEKGEQYGSDYYYEENWVPSYWGYSGKRFPFITTILTLIGLVFSIIAGLFSLFGYNTKERLIGGILGIISGGLIVTGELLFIEWGRWFCGLFSFTFTHRYFNFGFIVPVIIGSLIVIISIMFLIVEPKTNEKSKENSLLKSEENSFN
ncbi:MAG: hypothetical protein KGD59_08465 [Candidatus Heimdallarchaeota archaeon]|nr:hypothetical protein [Candidatus Heimdallarchaeota archaeon]MBY8994569.1 hypothetical protein [Candidatus Heimdallarchaeota archaeon]